MKKTVVIANLIDWSKSFVDENGSFYCGTTKDQKEKTAAVTGLADLVIFATDLHPVTSREHAINGGLYPAHNAIRPWVFGPDFFYFADATGKKIRLGDRTLSPCLTEPIQRRLENRKTGLIVPRDVYFQTGDKNWASPEDVEETFCQKIISPEQFLRGGYEYIIAPKQYYDATRLDSDFVLPKKKIKRIPPVNFNVFALLGAAYPENRYKIVFLNTGVVEGICRLHTSIGIRQMFPKSRVINLTDATTPLTGVGLGYDTAEQSRDACTRVCRDVGVEYMTAGECLEKFERKR